VENIVKEYGAFLVLIAAFKVDSSPTDCNCGKVATKSPYC
jgi:hypothetical protein